MVLLQSFKFCFWCYAKNWNLSKW